MSNRSCRRRLRKRGRCLTGHWVAAAAAGDSAERTQVKLRVQRRTCRPSVARRPPWCLLASFEARELAISRSAAADAADAPLPAPAGTDWSRAALCDGTCRVEILFARIGGGGGGGGGNCRPQTTVYEDDVIRGSRMPAARRRLPSRWLPGSPARLACNMQ